jgi:DNA-binding response OmpR family regulator
MVLDLGLPDMNGLELLQKLKRSQEHRNLPIIVYTGRDLSRRRRASSSGSPRRSSSRT